MPDALLRMIGLKKHFDVGKSRLHAVDGIDLEIRRGSTLGVVGESGCGKTTLGRTAIGLLPATDGQVLFEGQDITKLSRRALKSLRKDMQLIFQDPYSSLNPRHSVGQIIGEPMVVNGISAEPRERRERVLALMKTVGLAERLYDSYPHELDGGRRQRVGVARALSVNPKFIVCDEPVSALDVSIQAQILNLLMDLQDQLGLTYLFITHALSVARHISDEIAVMYLGQCVERAPSGELFRDPLHPYTRALLSAILAPSARTRHSKTEIIKGELTSPIDPKPGCRFASRCPEAMDACRAADPGLVEARPGHFVKCILHAQD